MDSEALQIFLIKSIDVSKVINNLPKLNYDDILFRYKKAFPDIKPGTEIELEQYIKSVNNAIPFMKKILINLKGFEESIIATMTQKENEINYYFNLLNVFEDYEKYTLMEYVNNDENKLVFYNPKNSEAYQKIADIKDKFINPFERLSSWIEDDILDFKAMLGALESIINLNALLDRLALRLKAIEEEILKYQNNEYNYFTLLFKWKTAEGILLELKNEENTTKSTIKSILHIITIASKITLDNLEIFKVEKLQRYHKHIKRFAEVQKNNGDIINDLWSYISNDPKLNDKDKDVVSSSK